MEAVAATDLIACVPERSARECSARLGLVVRPEPLGLPPFTIRMVWHTHPTDDPARVWLRGIVGEPLRRHRHI